MTNTLEKIIADKKSNVEKYKNSFTVKELKKKISSYKDIEKYFKLNDSHLW